MGLYMRVPGCGVLVEAGSRRRIPGVVVAVWGEGCDEAVEFGLAHDEGLSGWRDAGAGTAVAVALKALVGGQVEICTEITGLLS